MNTKVKGYFLGAIAAATYGTNPLFALPLYKDGMDPDSVLFFRYLFAIPILGMMIKGRGRSFKIEHKAAVPLIVMGLLVAFSSLALFQSYNYMEVGIASTLLFVYPIMVALIMALVFKEKLTYKQSFAFYWHYQVSVCSIKAVMAQHSVSPVFCWSWLQLSPMPST